MRRLMFAISALALSSSIAAAHKQAADLSCRSELAGLQAKWDAIGYGMPANASAALVHGRDGYQNTSGQVNYMRTQIRLAHQDCNAGDDAAALQRIATVQNLLEQPGRHR